MKNIAIKVIIGILLLLQLMYAEYRYIMVNLKPYRSDNETVYIEMFGNVDEYYADYIENLE
jgi:hypothetical protein